MKTLVVIAAVAVAFIPWMGGGRAPTAILISALGLLMAMLLSVRKQQPQDRILILAVGLWLAWSVTALTWTINSYQTKLWLLYLLLAVIAASIVGSFSKEQK